MLLFQPNKLRRGSLMGWEKSEKSAGCQIRVIILCDVLSFIIIIIIAYDNPDHRLMLAHTVTHHKKESHPGMIIILVQYYYNMHTNHSPVGIFVPIFRLNDHE